MTKILAKRNLAHFSLLTAQLCFSGWHIVGSLAMKEGADPFIFALYREIFASILMFLLVTVYNLEIKIDKSDFKRFICLGVFSFINVVGAMLSLRYISATRFAIFQPSIPCIATVISIFIKLEKFTFIKAAGILLAVGGAVITEVWSTGSDDSESNVALGTIIVSAQVCGMACLIVFSKPILHKYPSAVITFVYYSIGSVITLVLCACFAYQFTVADLYFNSTALPWLALAYASSFATLFPYNAFSWAGKLLSPSVTTVYCTFQPVGTIVLSFLVFHKMITASEGVGAAMVMCGLVVTVYGQNVERKASDEYDSDEEEGEGRRVEQGRLNPLLTGDDLVLLDPSAPPRTTSSASEGSVNHPYNPMFRDDQRY